MPEHARSRRRQWLIRAGVAALYIAVGVLLILIARDLDWADARKSLLALSPSRLATATACSLATYALYAGFEWLAARQVGISLPRRTVCAIGFASYACNLTLGATIGALALRVRLYAARSIAPARAASAVAFNLLTNWSGYLLVLGTALVVWPGSVPAAWPVGPGAARAIGVAAVCCWLFYLGICWRGSGRSWRIRGAELHLPKARIAGLQAVLATPVWLLSAASLALLMGDADYRVVLVSLLVSAVAGLIVRIPAGLGVTEAVMLSSLGSTLGQGHVLAALLAYRCVHYLLPLLLGLGVALVLEWRGKHGTGVRS
ncbi:lysylphosphatidylglycerol synthase transmembrane domain-containing protein [Dokdonella immobilis]|uniref:Lysylphosphatidylglycerol synthase TM region n=1 Tax=Dokdonella immobilis TaxID=578942 RepID=A0A1I4YBS2_9GAMM|nr:YbhN family protein [Dokdonella immobilis]SFN35173.1 hypothetical protein SAMN05216289_11630 [Dokdonella immobilis]